MQSSVSSQPNIAVLIVAAGAGLRAGGGVPKQYRVLGGKPLLTRTLEIFARFNGIADIIPVIGADQQDDYSKALAALPAELQPRIGTPVMGGTTRQESVYNGLCALQSRPPTHVLIHDGARAFISKELIARIIAAVASARAIIPGLAVLDTVKRVDSAQIITGTVPRDTLRLVQTPQAFDYQHILHAHQQAHDKQVNGLTDYAAIAEWAGMSVQIIDGEAENLKITTPEDFVQAEKMLMQQCWDIRVGQGYDVHALVPGDHVWLGGVRIPHHARLSGHSDADVLIHALVDAILGALGDGDIGVHFPPSNERWRGAPSRLFLEDAVARVAARGGFIAHLDGTLVCEGPKIGPYREEIRAKIAEIANISLDRVGLKATTAEKLGFVGRAEGIEAFATATLRLP